MARPGRGQPIKAVYLRGSPDAAGEPYDIAFMPSVVVSSADRKFFRRPRTMVRFTRNPMEPPPPYVPGPGSSVIPQRSPSPFANQRFLSFPSSFS